MADPVPHLTDEIMEEIFLRLDTPAALARASTACPRYRRVITQRSFLRRYRKRHPPPLLGLLSEQDGFHPAQAPHPSAPLARALAAAADFTYSFVPKLKVGTPPFAADWYLRDLRDGRALLSDSPGKTTTSMFRNLAVCDPLSRRYVLIPPIPKDLAVQEEKFVQIETMLAPVGDDEDETSFRVICPAHYTSKLVAFVFSSLTSNWCIAASTSWSSLGLVQPNLTLSDHSCLQGCFYWTDLCSFWRDKWLVLDSRTMEFSTIDFLTGYHKQLVDQPGQRRLQSSIVVGREEEALEMFSLVGDRNTKGSFAVHHTIQHDNDDSSVEWQLKEITPLSSQYYYYTVGAAEGFLLIGATTFAEKEWVADGAWLRQRSDFEVHYFSLDVRTSELTKVCSKLRALFDNESIFWYFGLPPSLSKPSI